MTTYIKYDGTLAVQTAAPATNFYGTSGTDTLTGTSANEGFWGGQGDLMTGLGGDDTYYVKSTLDQVIEQPGGGDDRIVAWQSINLANYPNVENVQVSGDGLYAAGAAGDNIVEGGSGAEQLYGGLGQDILIGGAGADTFIVVKGEGNDVIQDFTPSQGDVVRLNAGYTSFADVQSHLTQVGADVKLDLGGTDGLMFRNLTVGQLTAANFQLQLDPTKLGTMTFHDEFSSPVSIWDPTYNPSGTWRPDYGYQGPQGVGSYTLVGNNELEIYTSPFFRQHPGDFTDTPFVSNSDGTLSVFARPSTSSEIFGYHYISGLLTTQPTFSQTYGYFEMRAELPHAAGAWPAFWLLPADGSWPPELDVMENLGQDPSAIYTTEHSSATGTNTSQGVMSFEPPSADGYHTYGLLWTSTDLTWYIDGVQVFHTATPADMNKPMFILANMALGGWAGTVNDAALPAEMRIDYIRAYSLAGTGGGSGGGTGGTGGTTTPPAYTNALFTLPTSSAWTHSFYGGPKSDSLTGTTGPDYLDGKAGADTLSGGAGDDTYAVDRPTDVVIESAGGGIDTILSKAASYALPADVENLTLSASSAQTGIGNGLNNRMVSNDYGSTLNGGAGDDILVAGKGADVLTGGDGKDIFEFDKVPTKAGHVTDFTLGSDMVDLRGLFTAAHYSGSDPVADHYLSLKSDGAGGTQVWFDADGAGSGASVLVTTLDHVAPTSLTMQNDWFFR